MPARRFTTGTIWCLIAASVAGLLHAACLPFYSGASIGSHLHWRLEHGRLTVRRSAIEFHESFYIAINSERLRWAPEVQFSAMNDWTLTLPLWWVWAGGAIAAMALRRSGAAPGPSSHRPRPTGPNTQTTTDRPSQSTSHALE